MAFVDSLERQQEAVFARLGEDADWEGITDPVRVILRHSEEVIGLAVDDSVPNRVRRSEVASPAEGQEVTVS